MRIFLATMFCVFFSVSAQAGYLFTPSMTYLTQKTNDGTNPESRAKLTILDLRLGYTFDFGLYIGGLYSIHDQDITSDASDSYFGPSIGYRIENFLAVFTYYIYGERDLTDGSGKHTGVNGFQLDLTYMIPIMDGVYLGPQLTFHQIKFNEFEAAGFGAAGDYNWQGVSPYFNLTIDF